MVVSGWVAPLAAAPALVGVGHDRLSLRCPPSGAQRGGLKCDVCFSFMSDVQLGGRIFVLALCPVVPPNMLCGWQ